MITLKTHYDDIDFESILVDRGIYFGLFKNMLALALLSTPTAQSEHTCRHTYAVPRSIEHQLDALLADMKSTFDTGIQNVVLQHMIDGTLNTVSMQDIVDAVPTPLTNDLTFSAHAARDFNAAVMQHIRTWVLNPL